MDIAIERLTALALIVTSLSHITAPRAWIRYFSQMRARGDLAGIQNAFIHLPLGLIIVSFHWVWSWPGLLTTLVGCGLTLKGTLHALYPPLTQRTMKLVDPDKAWRFQLAGAVMLVPAVAIFWLSLR